ncbi:hypothetical protein PVAP13_5NG279300 [Panicum virgatum]|uniref:Secreted protein n=1 Tax=Panicum virgatum TaxID=38727 RepID=A0A8T0S088_PANVG|nr:hypothetical protein PVAP13_5NG279300 [Panicum virgatum]
MSMCVRFIFVQLFTAIRVKGAFLNGFPIKASSQDELVKALLVTEIANFPWGCCCWSCDPSESWGPCF